jgi:hypothetical protein
VNRRSRRALSRKEKQELIDGYRRKGAGGSKADTPTNTPAKGAVKQRSDAATAELMTPQASVEMIPPDDLADARANHRDAWGPQHVLERGKDPANANAYHCVAPGCSTVLVVDRSQAIAWPMDVDDE